MKTVPVMMMLLGCGSGTGSDDAKVEDTSSFSINSADDIARACEEGEPQTAQFTVTFPETSPPCPWGEGDNLDTQDAHMTARIEQSSSLSLPAGAVVCDMAFNFQGVSGGEGTPMIYDDNFVFTFNDVPLASSYAPLIDELAVVDGLPVYDWSRIAGNEFSFDTSIATWCLGEAEGRSACEIPPPETDGIMSLSFEASLANELSLLAIQQNRFEFSFITIGDNDASTDCRHADWAFIVDVPYVELGR